MHPGRQSRQVPAVDVDVDFIHCWQQQFAAGEHARPRPSSFQPSSFDGIVCVCEGHARKWEAQKPSGIAGSVYARAAFCSNFYISALPSLLKIRDASPALHALNGLFKAWPINRAGPSKKSTSGLHVPGWSNSTSRWHPAIPPSNYPSEMQWICLQIQVVALVWVVRAIGDSQQLGRRD